MPLRDDPLPRLVQAVADRCDVDWEAEATARPDLRDALKSLRVLQAIQSGSRRPRVVDTVVVDPDDRPLGSVARRRLRRLHRTWGHLEILERIGRGGFGDIMRAYDPRLQMEFALKLARPRRGRSLDREAFFREARALVRVRHPNVVAIYGADEHGGRLGLWAELIRGETLEEALIGRGARDAPAAAAIGIDVARALVAVHAAALVHRDVTTSNIMVEHGGRVVLMDLGAAFRLDDPTPATATGTPAFLAPETLRGEPATPRTDLYALGVVLYRLVTGSLPYEAATLDGLRVMHERYEAIPLRDRRPDLPSAFVEVVERALAPRPESRFSSAAEMARALAPLASVPSEGERDARDAPRDDDPIGPGAIGPSRPATTFVGRTREIADGAESLVGSPVVTLTGLGGSGKTRLAIRLAEHVRTRFDEVRFIDLAAADGARIVHSVAEAMGLREGAEPLEDRVVDRFRDRTMLLVLDHCEHVATACAERIEDWTRRCPALRILATSREPLGVPGERRLPVLPLSLPEPVTGPGVVEAARSDAVRLFVDRARAVRPGFRLTEDNAAAVSDICRRLDGLPLALELAAARVRLLSVDELRQMLDRRFRLLTDSPFSTVRRHRTLHAALEWSHEHLDADERRLLRRLSVFAGGWTLAAAFAVDAGERDDLALVDVLSRLADKSLIVPDEPTGSQSRFHMLDTIREFATERLEAEGEGEATRDRHAAYHAAVAEEAEPWLWGPDQTAWVARLEADRGNFLSALSWCADHDRPRGLRLAGALGRFWALRAHLSTGRQALRRALAGFDGSTPHPDLARALFGAGVLAAYQMDADDARALCARAVEMYRALPDRAGMARALAALGVVAHNAEDYPEAQRLYASSLELHREARDARGTAMALNNLGSVAWRQGRWRDAWALHQEALRHARDARDPDVLALALINMGFIAVRDGRIGSARTCLREALAVSREFGLKRHGVAALDSAAAALATCFESAKAARLYGASAAVRASIGAPMDAAWRLAHAPLQDRIARDSGRRRSEMEQAAGASMGFDGAIAEALKGLELLDDVGPRARSPRRSRSRPEPPAADRR